MDRSGLALTDEYMQRVQKIIKKSQGNQPPEEKLEAAAKSAQHCLSDLGVSLRDQEILGSEYFKESPAILAARDFFKQPKECWCLVLAGPAGRGKSVAAAYWLKRLAYHHFIGTRSNHGEGRSFDGYKQHWWSAQAVSRISSRDDSLRVLMQRDGIVIDDLGTEYMDTKGHTLHRFDEMIAYRYANFKRTLMTTNLNAEAFKERYWNRIVSRIDDGGMFFGLTGESLRGKQ